MKFSMYLIAWMSLTWMVGCGGDVAPAPTTTAEAPAPPAPAPPGKPASAADETEAVAAEDSSAAIPTQELAAEMPAAESNAPETSGPDTNVPDATEPAADAGGTLEKAQVGVGAKGRDYGGPGLVTTPVQVYFRTGDRIAFEIQIPSAMKLYKASHDNKGPKTHEEFMNVIIKENGVQLPELPEGDEFVYDPKTEQLMVRHPAQQQ